MIKYMNNEFIINTFMFLLKYNINSKYFIKRLTNNLPYYTLFIKLNIYN